MNSLSSTMSPAITPTKASPKPLFHFSTMAAGGGFWFGHEMLQTRGEFCSFSEAHLALFRHALPNHITCSTCASMNTWHHQASPCTCLCLCLRLQPKLKHGHRACLEVQGLSYASSTLGAGESMCAVGGMIFQIVHFGLGRYRPQTQTSLLPTSFFSLSRCLQLRRRLPSAKEKDQCERLTHSI